jgi:hypothetical protein
MTEFVFVTKYALTAGIKKFAVKEIDGSMVTVTDERASNGWRFFHGDDWHRTEADAVTRAKTMRRLKVASHERQIEKLKKMTFEVGS